MVSCQYVPAVAQCLAGDRSLGKCGGFFCRSMATHVPQVRCTVYHLKSSAGCASRSGASFAGIAAGDRSDVFSGRCRYGDRLSFGLATGGVCRPCGGKDRTGLHNNLDVFWIVTLCSAILSVGLATVQWLGIEGMNIFLLDMPAGGRPFANLGQPNNFCTLCFLGCASVLYFYERGMLRGAAFWLAWCWLSFGMALSQSRTGWLQITWLVAFLWWMGRRIQLQVTPRTLMGLGAVFVTWVAALPFLSDGLLIATGRTLGEQMQGGVRLQYWSSMLHAII